MILSIILWYVVIQLYVMEQCLGSEKISWHHLPSINDNQKFYKVTYSKERRLYFEPEMVEYGLAQ